MKNIVIFASGAGSNAGEIIRYFRRGALAKVAAVFCNKPDAGVIAVARAAGIECEIFTKAELEAGNVLERLKKYSPELIVLAGFLLKFPSAIISGYPGRIINIHPALLPKYGGKGMYGINVHKAVVENRETETGITIHYVDDHYDSGDIIAQYRVSVSEGDSCDEISAKVRKLEHEYYPKVIEKLLS